MNRKPDNDGDSAAIIEKSNHTYTQSPWND
jgi:hypothetical protein